MYETNTKDILRAQKGDKDALDKIIRENSGLTWSIVKRFAGRGHEIEDLYQIGCIGFIKAIQRFDTTYDVKISTYAVPYILGEIKRFIRDDGMIKVSRSIKELSIKIKELQKEYLNKNGTEITINKISEILKVSKEEIAVALDSSMQVESINEECFNDGKGESKLSKIERISTGKDEEAIVINKVSIKQLLEQLSEREREVILLRYYKDKTQTEVAKILGITQVQVSRMEKKILLSMRKNLAS